MPRQRKRGPGVCALCGLDALVKADHIPAKNLFLPPRALDLITVPVCQACDRGSSRDDEYFRLALAMRPDSAAHPSMVAMRPLMAKGLDLPEARGLAIKVLAPPRTLETVRVTEDGLIVPGVQHEVDHDVVFRVIERITRGLYFHHSGKPLPPNTEVVAVPEPFYVRPEMKELIRELQAEEAFPIGDRGEYSYQFTVRGDDERIFFNCLHTFYGAAQFVAYTGPASVLGGFDLYRKHRRNHE